MGQGRGRDLAPRKRLGLPAVAWALTVACAGEPPPVFSDVVSAQEALTPTVMALPGVSGTAVGLCEGVECITVYLRSPDSLLAARIPDEFGGYTVRTEVSGDLRMRTDSVG